MEVLNEPRLTLWAHTLGGTFNLRERLKDLGTGVIIGVLAASGATHLFLLALFAAGDVGLPHLWLSVTQVAVSVLGIWSQAHLLSTRWKLPTKRLGKWEWAMIISSVLIIANGLALLAIWAKGDGEGSRAWMLAMVMAVAVVAVPLAAWYPEE